MRGRGSPGLSTPYGVPQGQQIAEVDEDEFEDLQLYPFDEPTTEDVLWMAQLIGIHPIRDKQYLYLAQEALINPPNDEWMIFKDIAGNVIWINDITEEMEPHPPHLTDLIENFQRVKQKQNAMNTRGPSNDKSNAMKKILGRNLSSSDAPPTETPLTSSVWDKKQSRLPQRTQPPPHPAKPIEQPKPTQPPASKGRGGGMSLLKALQHSQQPAPEPEHESESKPESEKSENDESEAMFNRGGDDSSDIDDYDNDEKGIVVNEDYIEDGDGLREDSSVDQDESSEHNAVAEEVFSQQKGGKNTNKPVSQQEKPKQQRPATAKTDIPERRASKNDSKTQPSKNQHKKNTSYTGSGNETKKQKPKEHADDTESKQMLSKLMADFQDMQMKMSRIEEENSELRKKNNETSLLKKEIEVRDSVNLRHTTEPLDTNIKDGIAEIKKLLEKSILIQNDKGLFSDKNLEENKSVIMPMVDMSRPSEYMRAAFGGQNMGTTSQEQSSSDLCRHTTSMANQQRSSEFDSKWATIIMREKDALSTMRLVLHHAKLSLESRKLSIKRHEFEMKKELDTLKLAPGHPLAMKIRSNLTEQLNTFKSECTAWQGKCQKLVVKQKNLSLLEKSYQFTRNNGVLERESDKHLEELFELYHESGAEEFREDAERELGCPIDGDGLSLDTHQADFESEQHHHDMSNCKSEKQSHAEFIQKATASNYEPSEFNYNSADIRQSLVDTRYQRSTDTGRNSIRQYFSNQHKFYDSMRREVVDVDIGRFSCQPILDIVVKALLLLTNNTTLLNKCIRGLGFGV